MIELDIVFTEKSFCLIDETNRKIIEKFCKDNKGKKGKIIFKTKKHTRSHEQNSFFHSVVLDSFCSVTGDYDKQYLKHVLKEKFLTVTRDDGSVWVQDTHTLSTKDMSFFIDQCLEFLFSIGGSISELEYKNYIGRKSI